MDLQPMYRPIDYKVAIGEDEINKLLADGYDLHGDPSYTMTLKSVPGGTDEVETVRQVMVKRAPFDAPAYLNIIKHLILLQTHLQDVIHNPASLFTEEELKEVARAMGEDPDADD